MLVGAGHSHMEVIRRSDAFRAAGLDLTVVDPGDFWFAGRAAGLLSGTATRDNVRVGLSQWCERHGVEHVAARAVGLAHRHRRLWLASGQTLDYGALSLNVGGEIDQSLFDARDAQVRIWPSRPVRVLWQLHQALDQARARNSEAVIAVVGGGGAGCEAAANIAARVAGSRMRVLLVTRGARLWCAAPQAAASRVMRELAVRGVDIVLETSVAGSARRAIVTRDGRRFTADHVVLATGLRAPQLTHASALPASERGLHVGTRLYSPADDRVFAVGGCADFMPGALRCQGAHDLRPAAVLAHNLMAGLRNRPYRRYRPQRYPLISVDLGDGTAVACRGRLWWHGTGCLAWKRRLDARFMVRFQSPGSE